jgi:hypothetical protein
MVTTETTTTRLTKAQVIETIVNELWDARTALSAQNRTRRGYWTGRCDALAALLTKLCPEHPALNRSTADRTDTTPTPIHEESMIARLRRLNIEARAQRLKTESQRKSAAATPKASPRRKGGK